MKFSIFDVDLTLTKKDTFIEFYKFLCKYDKRFCAYFNKVINSGVLYGLKIYNEKKSKEQYISFFKGISTEFVDYISERFFDEYIMEKLLYYDAFFELYKRKNEGYKVVLISASPEFYLKYFKKLDCVDYVLGTRFEVNNGFYTGKINGFNNKGREKVFRFYEFLCLNKFEEIDLGNSVMYSDSLHDLPMFNIVGDGFLINNKKKVDKLLNLSWK